MESIHGQSHGFQSVAGFEHILETAKLPADDIADGITDGWHQRQTPAAA